VNRRLLAATAVVATAALAAAPGYAATKKPKPIKKTYTVALPPDPTNDVFNTAGSEPVNGFCGANTASEHRHDFTVPARGSLKVNLKGSQPLPAYPGAGLDWDLYLVDADGAEIQRSAGQTGQEETFAKFKKKQKVTILVCNLNGTPDATVSYVFTYS